MSNELKIGILAIAIIALTIWGYNFIKGKNMLVQSTIVNVEYDDIDQMKLSTPVFINGFQVGIVKSIRLNPENLRTILVQLDLRNDIKIPKDSEALIVGAGIMGGKSIKLEFDGPCSGEDCVKSGDFIKGRLAGMIESMLGSDMSTVDDVKGTVLAVADTFSHNIINPDPNSSLGVAMADIQVIMANLKRTTYSLDNMIRNSNEKVGKVMDDLSIISDALQKNNGKIVSMLDNADQFATKLNGLNLEDPLASADASLKELEKTLVSTKETMDKMGEVFTTIQEGDGTLSKLIREDDLYNGLSELSRSLTFLTSDMRENPERYRRIFAKKTKKDPIRSLPEEIKQD